MSASTGNLLLGIAKVEGLGKPWAQTISLGRHHLSADEPIVAGGTDAGPAPFQLLLASLGACTSITLEMYAARKGWQLGQLTLTLTMHREGDADRVERVLHCSAELTAEQQARLLEIAGKTPVTKVLLRSLPITTRFAT
jgi:putative redox protein